MGLGTLGTWVWGPGVVGPRSLPAVLESHEEAVVAFRVFEAPATEPPGRGWMESRQGPVTERVCRDGGSPVLQYKCHSRGFRGPLVTRGRCPLRLFGYVCVTPPPVLGPGTLRHSHSRVNGVTYT